MPIYRVILSALRQAGSALGEVYCAFGQKIGEQLEKVSDTLAERRQAGEAVAAGPAASSRPAEPTIELKEFRAVNGHKHIS